MRLVSILLASATIATSAYAAPPVQVTRFSTAGDIQRGAARPESPTPSLEQRSYEDAVGRELARLGFGPDDAPRYTYSVEVTRETRARPARRSPFSIGIGGGTGGYGGGVGLGASFGIGGKRSGETTAIRLFVQLREREGGKVVWEGRAEGESRPSDNAVVDRLATALFRDFPGESGRTITVK
ncbi:MAG: DUF4136 domain-containing protein [Sphingomonadales bacterium]